MRNLLLFLPFSVVVAGSTCESPVDPPGGDCSDTSPCGDDLVCQEGLCVTPCTGGACGDAVCDTRTGLCVECLDDGHCGQGRVCNRFSSRCVVELTDCSSDQQCESRHCDLQKAVCVECFEASDCALGFSCDPMSRTCIVEPGCANDDACDGGDVCDPALRVCVECFLDAHCPSENCDVEAARCIAGCTDVASPEPGEGAAAVAIESGADQHGTICAGDIDEFTVQAEGTVDAALILDGAAAMTLHLLNAAGATIATGEGDDSNLVLHAEGLAAGTWRLRVQGSDNDVQGDYVLRATVTQTPTCAELDPEPNDALADATVIAGDGTARSGAVCGDNIDLWQLTAAQGDDITAQLIPAEGAGFLSIQILDESGATLVSANPASLTNADAGTYYVRIAAVGGDATYSLRVTADAEPPPCSQLDAEPNNDADSAGTVTPGTARQGTICAGDVDVWRFSAVALDDAAIRVTGISAQVQVVDEAGAVIGSGASINADNLAAGVYRVVIEGQQPDSQGEYSLSVTLTAEPQPDPCLEAGAEPDSAAQPRTLPPDGVARDGRICAGESDFWRVDLSFQTRLSIRVAFTHAQGDVDIRLRDAAGTLIGSSRNLTNEERITRQLGAGAYTVEVFGHLGAVNTYSIEATLEGCAPEDGFENNNTLALASPIGAVSLDAVRCPGDDDFFLVDLVSGDELDVRLVPTTGALQLSLLAENGGLIASDTPDGTGRQLQAAPPTGSYVLRVTGTEPARVSYQLTPRITPTPARCLDDGSAPNQSFSTAFVLAGAGLGDGSYELSALTACSGRDDFFAIDLPAHKLIRITLDHDVARDVDIHLVEARGTSALFRNIATGVAVSALDSISGTLNAGGRFVIRERNFGALPAAGFPYGVGIEISDPPSVVCVDDRFDTWSGTIQSTTRVFNNNFPVDTDGNIQIQSTPVDLSPPESLTTLRACANNDDWYRVNLTTGQTLRVIVQYTYAAGRDVDVGLFAPSSQAIGNEVASGTRTTGPEDFSYTAQSSGNHFIRVFGFNGGENSYSLAVSIEP